MNNILKLNSISPLVNNVFKNNYKLVDEGDSIAILVRSFNMHEYSPSPSVLCIGRAGAGTNNIPLKDYAKNGIVVFNTPGANANAVKELVLAALFLSSRKINEGITWANGLTDNEKSVSDQVEKGKNAFSGCEILGKTLGVYGLGAIGRKISEAAISLGMNVVGFDPYLPKDSVINGITILTEKEQLFKSSDYITLHIPLTNETRYLINNDSISLMKDGVKIINCSRGEIVDNQSIITAAASGKVSSYITDFPNADIVNKKNIIAIPHLGASTEEAEDNCAIMASQQIVDFIENGNIINSVNFPSIKAERNGERTVVLFSGSNAGTIQNALINETLTAFSTKSNAQFGVALIDTKSKLSIETITKLNSVAGIIKIRQI